MEHVVDRLSPPPPTHPNPRVHVNFVKMAIHGAVVVVVVVVVVLLVVLVVAVLVRVVLVVLVVLVVVLVVLLVLQLLGGAGSNRVWVLRQLQSGER